MLRFCSFSSASLSQPNSERAVGPTVALNREGSESRAEPDLPGDERYWIPTQKGKRRVGGQAAPPMWEHLQRSCRVMKLFFFIIESVGRNQGFLELQPKDASWP